MTTSSGHKSHIMHFLGHGGGDETLVRLLGFTLAVASSMTFLARRFAFQGVVLPGRRQGDLDGVGRDRFAAGEGFGHGRP